jgi:transposase
MATERLAMHRIKEILRQKVLGRSHREVARALGVSVGLVSGVVTRTRALGLDAKSADALGDDELEVRLYGPRTTERDGRPLPDPVAMHVELRRVGVTLELLHLEYLERHPEGYRYTTFCDVYRDWLRKRSPTMKQRHVGGDKMFVDYSGKRPSIVDGATGEIVEVELYVAVLGASSYTYVEATRTQQVPDFVASTTRALAFIDGVPRAIVPDQLKSAVTSACRYEPGIQRTFEELGRHYGTTILPARPASPRDKAKVEVGVQVAQRWVLARLRNETFYSLGALNARIGELSVDLNARVMKVYKASRAELFAKLDKPALAPLPQDAFECAEWKKVRLNVDYHVAFDDHYYSAPHTLIEEELWARATTATVEVFHRGARVASHTRSHAKFKHTTQTDHMPSSHRKHAEWTPSRILGWARTVGPMTERLAQAILDDRRHPEWGYRSCLGLFRLAQKYDRARVEAACARAFEAGARSYRPVAAILSKSLDRAPALEVDRSAAAVTCAHENVRGPDYYN